MSSEKCIRKKPCNGERCDDIAGQKTFAHQAIMPISGRPRAIDWCIHHIVAALNAGGVQTTSSCCGHGKMPGLIMLKDGRVLGIYDSMEDATKYGSLASKYHSHPP